MAKVSKLLSLAEIAQIVDGIGALKAQIAPLEKTLKAQQEKLKALGAGRYEGALYDATIFTQVRDLLDMDAVRAKLSPQFMAAHSRSSESVICKVTAKQLAIAA